jgi:hypothetical protein
MASTESVTPPSPSSASSALASESGGLHLESSITPNDSVSQVRVGQRKPCHTQSNRVYDDDNLTSPSASEEENHLRGGFFPHTTYCANCMFTIWVAHIATGLQSVISHLRRRSSSGTTTARSLCSRQTMDFIQTTCSNAECMCFVRLLALLHLISSQMWKDRISSLRTKHYEQPRQACEDLQCLR